MSTFEGFHQEISDWIKGRQDKTHCDAALNLVRSKLGIRALKTIWEEPAKYMGKQEPIVTTHKIKRDGKKVDLRIVKVPALFEQFAEIYLGTSNGMSANQWQPYILIAEAIEHFFALHGTKTEKAENQIHAVIEGRQQIVNAWKNKQKLDGQPHTDAAFYGAVHQNKSQFYKWVGRKINSKTRKEYIPDGCSVDEAFRNLAEQN